METPFVPDVYSSLLYNPLCVLLFEDPSEKPNEWENVCNNSYHAHIDSSYLYGLVHRDKYGKGGSLMIYRQSIQYATVNHILVSISQVSVTFTRNEALVGSSVYMNNIDLCSWIQLENPFFDTEGVFRWEFVNQV